MLLEFKSSAWVWHNPLTVIARDNCVLLKLINRLAENMVVVSHQSIDQSINHQSINHQSVNQSNREFSSVQNSVTRKKPKFLTLDWKENKEGASQMKAFSFLKKTGLMLVLIKQSFTQ